MIRRSSSRSSSRSEATSDGLENYDALEQIGRGGTSTVYVAVCKRGRLRNRKVAIKKIQKLSSPTQMTPAAAHSISSASLHHALHHPTIVSLLSTFSTPSAHYHVLELCSHGALQEFLLSRDPPILQESEMRGVAKSLVEALTYLRKERVVHRDIKASNILLTGDYRVKLADFGLAKRLPMVNSTTRTFCGSPNYVSPEIVSHSPYSFATDLWSLGCLMITCLSGRPPFEAEEVSLIFDKISSASYRLPDSLSCEARDLISSLLQDQAHRIPLYAIMTHSFFDPALPTQSLGPVEEDQKENYIEQATEKVKSRKPRLKSCDSSPLRPRWTREPAKEQSNLLFSREKATRTAFREIGNTDLRNLLCDEISSSIKGPKASTNIRRIVSDPLPHPAGSLTSEFVALTSRSRAVSATPSLITDTRASSEPHTLKGRPKAISPGYSNPLVAVTNKDFESQEKGIEQRPHPSSSVYDGLLLGRPLTERTFLFSVLDYVPAADVELGNQLEPLVTSSIPIGTTRPLPFTMSQLSPQTHKLVSGQVTVLPSLSLLVDLREGERRRGQSGDEVFIVNPDGLEIKVYSAPHLSTPCCLAEPLAVHVLDDLPPRYWKQYNDAGRVVAQIKQRTPKLIMYIPEAKCTLMLNAPRADIELLFPPPHSSTHTKRNRPDGHSSRGTYAMRIRLSRQQSSLEFACRNISGQNGEWTKRTIKFLDEFKGETCGIREAEWTTMVKAEKEGMKCLLAFLRVCEIAEKLDEKEHYGSYRSSHSRTRSVDGFSPSTAHPQSPRKPSPILSSTVTKATSVTHIAQRLPKPPYPSAVNVCRTIPTPGHSAVAPYHLSLDSKVAATPTDATMTSPYLSSGEYVPGALQTRYIPHVGWCIRHGSRVSQGGRYRIMFLDGIALDVDVDEEWVEFTGKDGNAVRYGMGQGGRVIGDRMKVFEEFVSMFDDGED